MSRSSSVSIEGISSKNKIRVANSKNESRVANSRNTPKKLPVKSKSIASKTKDSSPAKNIKAPVVPVKVILFIFYYTYIKIIMILKSIQYRVSQIESKIPLF